MTADSREQRLTQAFVQLSDSLVAEYDLPEMLERLTHYCVELLDTAAAGLLLADQRGNLKTVAASSEATRVLELFQLQNEEGPCADCFRYGKAVVVEDVRHSHERWPRFTPLAEHAGYLSVHAFPMRLRDEVIGALNIFRASPGALADEDVNVGQALADVATISILQSRTIARTEGLAEQLQNALHSRVVIEQAKGMLAQRADIELEEAFNRMRNLARTTNRRLSEVCRDVVRGHVDASLLNSHQR